MKTFTKTLLFALRALPALLLLQAAHGTTLNYDAPVLESGTDLSAGAVYRFSNVASGIDALVTITSLNNGASIGVLDDFSQGGFQSNFQPTLTGTPSSNPSAAFHFQFVATGTSNPMIANDVNWTILDDDGTSTLSETNTVNNFNTYTIDNPTNLAVQDLGGGTYKFSDASGTTQNGIGTGGAYAVELHYDTVAAFDVSIGLQGTSNSSTNRLFSEGTNAADFTNPITLAPEPGSALLVGVAGMIFMSRRLRRLA